MQKIIPIVLAALFLAGCTCFDQPDFRQTNWGMTKEQVKSKEPEELLKDGKDILTYRIKNEDNEYDLLYVFKDGRLGMAVLHLRDKLPEPNDYLNMYKMTVSNVSKDFGPPVKSLVDSGGDATVPPPIEDPSVVCEGKTTVKSLWPNKNESTNVSVELDQKPHVPEPDCNLSIFFESVEFAVDPDLAKQLHELL